MKKTFLTVAGLLATGIFGVTVQAEVQNPDTDWFRDAHWGVFVHYLGHVQNDARRIATKNRFARGI